MLEIFIDGACHGNPGEASIGVVIHQNKKRLKEISKAIGPATNNVAEYTALIYALQEALILKASRVLIHTDSELLFNQIRGSYKVKNKNLKSLFDQARHLWEGFQQIEIKLVRRQQNQEADQLASQALKNRQAKGGCPGVSLLMEAKF